MVSENCTPFLHSLLTKGKFWGSGLRLWGFRVEGWGFRGQGVPGFQGSRFSSSGFGPGFRVRGLGVRV